MDNADDCPHVAAWLRTPPRISGPLDDGALVRITGALFDIGVACARAGESAEYRAALLKALALIDATAGVDLNEDDVFAVSDRLRQAIYLEVMTYRRAARADIDMEAIGG